MAVSIKEGKAWRTNVSDLMFVKGRGTYSDTEYAPGPKPFRISFCIFVNR